MSRNKLIDTKQFGLRLTRYRKARGLFLEQLANKIGATHGAISNIETGKNLPRTRKFINICNALKVSPDVLLQGIDKTSLIFAIEEYARDGHLDLNNLQQISVNKQAIQSKYDLKHFTANLKKYRLTLGYTQAQLAEMADISTHYYSVIETGVKPPSMAVLRKLSNVLEIPAACLLSDAEPMRFTDPDAHDRLTHLSAKELKRLAVVLEALSQEDDA